MGPNGQNRMNHLEVQVWVIDHLVNEGTLERLGDGRLVADQLGVHVGVLLAGAEFDDPERLIQHGADRVVIVSADGAGQRTRLNLAREILSRQQPRLVLAPGDCSGREWASLLAVGTGWHLISPALMLECRDDVLKVYGLDETGKYARQVELEPGQTAVVTLRSGVAEVLPANSNRKGSVTRIQGEAAAESISRKRFMPADPKAVDIRFARRLVAGGRGVGSKEGFDTLKRFADCLDAGIAASRMAVDLGWIEAERQVGQTGKTVKPALYVACGISGATHHLDGMSEAEHIVAINTDKEAPIFKVAHLGLVADLHEVLNHVVEEISGS